MLYEGHEPFVLIVHKNNDDDDNDYNYDGNDVTMTTDKRKRCKHTHFPHAMTAHYINAENKSDRHRVVYAREIFELYYYCCCSCFVAGGCFFSGIIILL